MSNSKLVNYTKLTKACNPRNQPISKITIHHWAGQSTLEAIGGYFGNVKNEASSNYAIDSEGRVAMYVEECNRAWTSSSAWNDHRAVTIEVEDCTGAPTWKITDAALSTLVELCVDICQRNNIPELKFTGDKNGSLTLHRFYAATDCPGAYIESKIPYICEVVNARLKKTTVTTNNTTVYRVRKSWSDIKSQLGAFRDLNNAVELCRKHKGYNVFDGNGKVMFSSATGDIDAIARAVIAGKYGVGQARKQKLEAEGYNYAQVQARVNELMKK